MHVPEAVLVVARCSPRAAGATCVGPPHGMMRHTVDGTRLPGEGGIFRALENMNYQILARQNPCNFLKMTDQIMSGSQKLLNRNSGRLLPFPPKNTKHTAQHNDPTTSGHVCTSKRSMQTPVCTSAFLQLPGETDYHKPTPLAWYKWAKAQPNEYLCKSLKTPNKLRAKISHRI